MSLTFLPFVARAAVEALRTFPIVNASIDGTSIIYHNEINLGIAVALENGLIVPVIRNADERNVLGLQRAIVDLASRARARQLKPDEIQGGTFSITNFGSFGSVFSTPISRRSRFWEWVRSRKCRWWSMTRSRSARSAILR
jgi:pyruvate dehydrogenase E2 component (dihydrolipoamide acetyltransferase)